MDLAARKLGVAAGTLKVTDGIINAPDGRKLGYGDLAAAANLKREATAKVPPKPPAQHKIVGKSAPRSDIPAKVMGGAAFVQDVRLPAMPLGLEGTLKPDEVYSLTAYLLFLNKVIPEDQVLDKESLPKVKMPIGDEYGRLPDWKPGTRRLEGYPY